MLNATLQSRLQASRQDLRNLCKRYGIRQLALFGSVLRSDFRPGSDVDVLADFEPGCKPGLALIDIQDELTQLLGYPADLRTPQHLSAYFRERVLAEAEIVYP